MKCNQPLAENHTCTPTHSLHSSLSFPFSPSQGLTRFQLSPLKRSFDCWTEDDSSGPSSPAVPRNFSHDEDPSQNLFGDDNEVINLPSSIRSPNKTPKLDKKKSRRNKNAPKWSSFSFHNSFLAGGKPKGHLKEIIDEEKKKSFSFHATTPGFTFVSSALDAQHRTFAAAASISAEMKTMEHATYDPSKTQHVNATFHQRSPSVASVQSEASSTTVDCMVEDETETSNNGEGCTKIEGIGLLTGLEDDLSELDLSVVVLDCNENSNEWQKLMIYTPTSRNRPEVNHRKPVIVRETVFEEKESTLVSGQEKEKETVIVLAQPPVFSAFVNAAMTANPIVDENLLMDMIEIAESKAHEHSQQPESPEAIYITMEEEEEEVFKYLSEHHTLGRAH